MGHEETTAARAGGGQQQEEAEVAIPFPFQPYPAQRQLMQQLYRTMDRGHVGLFESPTGTGKSLSLICAGLRWLRDRQQKDDAGEPDPAVAERQRLEKEKERGEGGGGGAAPSLPFASSKIVKKTVVEPDWLREYGAEKQRAQETERRRLIKERRAALQARLVAAREAGDRLSAVRKEGAKRHQQQLQKQQQKAGEKGPQDKGTGNGKEEADEEDADLLPAEYHSEDESAGGSSDESGLWSDSSDDERGRGRGGGGSSSSKKKKGEKKDKGKGKKGRQSKPGVGAAPGGEESDGHEEEGEELDRATLKILYCSRTHSQVSQFVMEVGKTCYKEDARIISLSSRKNLCVNEEVLRLGSDARMNDRCLDMQKGKAKVTSTTTAVAAVPTAVASSSGGNAAAAASKKQKVQRATAAATSSKKCPFLEGAAAGEQQAAYRDQALSRVRNLEDLADLGVKLGTCPYYGTRRAVAQAEVICMPYATLLHKATRESLRIPLKGNVVLVDEAHNLIEAINAVHTSLLPLQQMSRALGQVTLYWERYSARLGGKNAFYVQQILRILRGLVDFVRRKVAQAEKAQAQEREQGQGGDGGAGGGVVMSVNALLFETGMDNVNLFKVVRYMAESQIAKKVLGFAERRLAEVQIHEVPSTGAGAGAGVEGEAEGAGEAAEYVSSHVSSLQVVQAFLGALTQGSSQDGRIVLETGLGPQKGWRRPAAGLKYAVLNAAVHFKEVVEEARAVVLIGGTLQPVAPLVSQLFPDVSPQRIDVFVCGHVIPPQNLTALCLSKGPTGVAFDFTHKSRGSPEQMDELGRALLNVCTVTPGGVVVFLPSYQYEDVVLRRWKETGTLSKLQAKKPIFNEPKRAKDVDSVLQAYAAAIEASGGALLLCVVGAKMSEGINFADQMARCVVMVGLPYPDSRDPELQQKLQYLDGLKTRSGAAFGTVSGKSYYQNLCMRAVNQSIGRAIRHANDWAAIVLVDRRYFSDPSIMPLLPKWIADRVVPHARSAEFGKAFVHLTRFFREKTTAGAAAVNAGSSSGGGGSKV